MTKEELMVCEDIIQTTIHTVRELTHQVKRNDAGIEFVPFVPRTLELAMLSSRVTCSKYPCQTCSPLKHRHCTMWLLERLPKRRKKWVARHASSLFGAPLISEYVQETRSLLAECLAALQSGYGKKERNPIEKKVVKRDT